MAAQVSGWQAWRLPDCWEHVCFAMLVYHFTLLACGLGACQLATRLPFPLAALRLTLALFLTPL